MFAGQFTREGNGVYEMVTLYVKGDRMHVSVFVNDIETDDIITHSEVDCHKYFRFDFILAMLVHGWS